MAWRPATAGGLFLLCFSGYPFFLWSVPARCSHHRPGLCGGHEPSSISENRLSYRAPQLMNATRIPPQETLESSLRILVHTLFRFNLTLSDHTAHETLNESLKRRLDPTPTHEDPFQIGAASAVNIK
ncbi:hypothetical protein H4582DRAFT_2032068 [Lactarius indigo]|nr:hypothetical protein H4582DRAFT_2032068 [Lactarius indigo]